jgi:fructose-1,6-bisphosphatase
VFCNQTWLDKLVKSGCVQLLVSKSANAVIEVDQEHQGQLVVAFDPLSMLSGAAVTASSTFGIWRR